MMLSLLVLAVPAMPSVPRSGLPTRMDGDWKVTQALRRASGLEEVRLSFCEKAEKCGSQL